MKNTIPSLLVATSLIGAPVSSHANIQKNGNDIHTIITQTDPNELFWNGKIRFETILVGTNLFAIYDFDDYVLFEQDMADANDKMKKKRYIIYAKKTPIGLTFLGHYEGSSSDTKNLTGNTGKKIKKTKKVPSDLSVEDLLREEYNRYLREHP